MEGLTKQPKNTQSIQQNGGTGFVQLFISKQLIQGAATAILGIFVPIFLYETTGELFYIVGGYYVVLVTR